MKKNAFQVKFVAATAALMILGGLSACTGSSVKREISESSPASEREQILQSIRQVHEYALAQLKEGNHWNYPLYMGIGYTSQYYLFTKWLNIKDPKLDERKLLETILDPKYRLNDGSWYQVKDPKLEEGHLDSTIMNYWAMKVMGPQKDAALEDQRKKAMAGAREFINRKGGVGSSTLFAKVILALFSQISWDDFLFFIPPGVDPTSDSLQNDFAQWVRPHLIPIVYMRYLRVRKVMKDANGKRDERFDLSELQAPLVGDEESASFLLSQAEFNKWVKFYQGLIGTSPKIAIEKILETQQPKGSWGGYTSATLFSLVSMDDYLRRDPGYEKVFDQRARAAGRRTIAEMRAKALAFTSGYYVDNGLSNYLGTVCDGRYWDTILIHRGLTESDNAMTAAERAQYSVYPLETAKSVVKFLMNAQLKSGPKKGGIPFGYEFEYAPDVDDTAELVTAYASSIEFFRNRGMDEKDELLIEIRKRMESGLQWILKMQNSDGGWAAFDKDNVGNLGYEIALSNFKDSADLFDDSSEDVTGHVLEAFGRASPYVSVSLVKGTKITKAKDRAFSYLWKTQKWRGDKNKLVGRGGPWYGRWGINYIYGTNAALVGVFSLLTPEQIKQVNSDSFFGQLGRDIYSNTGLLGYRYAMEWLQDVQSNRDGGFGESIRSYTDNKWWGKGESTPSQTAWALGALVAGGRGKGQAAQWAVGYLLRNLEKLPGGGAKWSDGAVVGTGHPEIVYLEYPSYPIAFPLISLGEYLKAQSH